MANMELLEKKITDSGMTIVSICDKSGVKRATLYNRLKGKGEWRADEIIGVSNALGLKSSDKIKIFLT